jgi:hypothetical protein
MGEAARRARFAKEAPHPFTQHKGPKPVVGEYEPQIPVSAAKMNIQVLIPSGRGLWPIEFSISLISAVTFLMTHPPVSPIAFNIEVAQSATLQENRERLIKKGLTNGGTHLILLDDDHTFPADTFVWMLQRDQDVLLTNYVRRTVPTSPVARGLDGKINFIRPESTGLEEIRYSGLGVSCIKAHVFDNMEEPWFDFIWGKHPETGQWIIERSEDVVFLDKCREQGFKVMLDYDLSKRIEHLGQFAYTWVHALTMDEQRTIIGG